MRNKLVLLAVLLVFCWPLGLMAQEEDDLLGAPVTEEDVAAEEAIDEAEGPKDVDSRGVETWWGDEDLNDVEKGFYINSRLGTLIYLGSGYGDYANAGIMYGLGLGYDILPKWLSLEVGAIFNFHGANILDENGLRKPDAMVRGDFGALRVPVALNVRYFTTKRVELYVSVTGGLNYNAQSIDGFDANGDSIGGNKLDGYAGGRVGVEYYTGLRHFSIGLDMEFDYIFSAKSMALAIAPTLKYTF